MGVRGTAAEEEKEDTHHEGLRVAYEECSVRQIKSVLPTKGRGTCGGAQES